MNKKLIGVAAALVALLLVGGYLGSPYLAMKGLRDAAIAKDRDQLEARVDFPAVRESLKAQLNALMMREMQKAPEAKDNPFAGLVALIVPAIVDRAIDAYVTPEGMVALSQGDRPQVKATGLAPSDVSAPAMPAPEEPATRARYVNLGTFQVATRDKSKPASGEAVFVFRRKGLFAWRLVRIDLPKDLGSQ